MITFTRCVQLCGLHSIYGAKLDAATGWNETGVARKEKWRGVRGHSRNEG